MNKNQESLIRRARRQTLGDLLRRSAARAPEKLAIACGDTVRWSYRQFDSIVDELASVLMSEYGVTKGARVAVLARNSHWFAALRFALARAGAVMVPINFMLNAEEVAYILRHSEAELLCTDAEFAPCAQAAASEVEAVRQVLGMPGESSVAPGELPDLAALISGRGDVLDIDVELDGSDLLQIVYTSGTESRPKGALLTHDAVISEYVTCLVDAGIESNNVMLHALPLYHCAQLDVFLGPAIYVGATSIITAQPTPDNIISIISEWGVNSFFAPPTVWIAILAHPDGNAQKLGTLNKGYYGASIMPVEVLKSLQARLPALRLWNLYGQTEIAPVATVLKPEDQLRKAGSAGKPALNVETQVVRDDGQPVAPGEIGEVVHRSPQLLSGYYNDPEKTAEAFIHGWFHSGDLATVDDEGFITIVDRKKDMIKTGGENVSSREVEEAIYQLAGIEEVAVIGIPDAKWIEAVTAVIVRGANGADLSEAQVLEHCSGLLAGFKQPKRVEFVNALPKNPSGKVLKRELRLKFAAEA